MKEKVIRSTLFSGTSNVVMTIIGFLLLPFMINRLGATKFGLIGLSEVFMIGGYIALFEIGAPVAVTKYTAEYNRKKQFIKISELLSSSFFLFLILGFLLMITGLFLVDFFVNAFKIPVVYTDSFKLVLIFIFSSYLFQFPTLILKSFLEGLHRFDITKSFKTLTYFLYAGGVMLLLLLKYDYTHIIMLQLLTLFILFAGLYYCSLRANKNIRLSVKFLSLGLLKEIMPISGLLWIQKISSVVLNNGHKIIISIFLGPAFVTSYHVSMKIPKALKNLVGFVNSTLVPTSSELFATRNKVGVSKLFIKTTRYYLFLLFPGATGAMFFSSEILRLWIGKEYVNLTHFHILALLWTILSVFVTVGGAILVGMNRRLKMIVGLGIIVTFLNIFLPLVVIQQYGLITIFLSMVIVSIVMLPFVFKIFVEELGINIKSFMKELVKLVIPGFIPLVVLLLIKQNIIIDNFVLLLLVVFLWCFIYWILLYFLLLDNEDREILKGIKGKFLGNTTKK